MTREEFFYKYGCECKDPSCSSVVKEKCSAEFYHDLDSVIENQKNTDLPPAEDFNHTLNPNPDFGAERDFVYSLEMLKNTLTYEDLCVRLEDFILSYGVLSFKAGEVVKEIMAEAKAKVVKQDAD